MIPGKWLQAIETSLTAWYDLGDDLLPF